MTPSFLHNPVTVRQRPDNGITDTTISTPCDGASCCMMSRCSVQFASKYGRTEAEGVNATGQLTGQSSMQLQARHSLG